MTLIIGGIRTKEPKEPEEKGEEATVTQRWLLITMLTFDASVDRQQPLF